MVCARADFEEDAAMFDAEEFDAFGARDGPTAFRDLIGLGSGDEYSCGGGRRNFDGEMEPAVSDFPIADGVAAHGIVGGPRVGQVANDVWFDDDVFEGRP